MKLKLMRGYTGKLLRIFIADSSQSALTGLTGLAFNSSGLTWYYCREGDASTTAVSLVSATLGTYVSGGFAAVDAAHMPGWYEIGVPNAALSSGNSVIMHLSGASNMTPVLIEIELDAVNYQSQLSFITGINTQPVPANWSSMAIDGNGRVQVQSGTGAGQINASAGVVSANVTQFSGQSVILDANNLPSVNAKDWNGTPITTNVPNTAGVTLAAVNPGVAAADVWNAARSSYVTAGSFGQGVSSVQGSVTGSLSGSVGSVTGSVTVGAYAGGQDPGTYVLQTGSNKLNTDTTGRVLLQPTQTGVTIPSVTTVAAANLNLAQSVPTSNSAQTIGDALNAARAQGFGKWVLSGTTLSLYAADGSTIVRSFTLDSATAPTQRS
jgi:hypothetical protein